MSYRDDEPRGGPSQATESTVPESYSLIDRHTKIEGTVSSERDLRVEGQLRGELHCQGLVQIAEGADVDATVQASRITVAGSLKGTLTCVGKFQILPTGRVQGTLVTKSLVINEGAVFEGELRMDVDAPPMVATTVTEPATNIDEDETTGLLRRIAGSDSSHGQSDSSSSGAGESTTNPPESTKKQPR